MTSASIINYQLEFGLRVFGIWPSSSYAILKIAIWTMLLSTSLVFQYWYCITRITSSNLVDVLDGLSLTLSNTLVLLKLIVIWFYNRTFRDIQATWSEDWSSNSSSRENKQIMIDKSILSSRITNFFIAYFGISFFLYVALALVSFGENNDESVSKTRQLLIRMEFPFEYTASPVYEFIVVVQFIFEAFIVYAAAASIALIAALMLHVGSQVDIFCQKLIELSNYSGKDKSQSLVIRDIVTRHQKIIRLSKNIEKVFTYISLGQFLLNISVICFISFVLVVSLNMEHGFALALKCFPYYIAINCEAFILCYTGEYLTSKGENITAAVYHFLWYNLKSEEARDILFIIMQSRSQLKLTAGKFVTLSLQTYANMLKTSASYVSVLYAMY
ncbi:odorant receptor 13a-like [Andrena cerasifolii]|uniref:odorant receptor 13a-like n=1 Tax=Andrena cerasifolii TaxID=2819439 RepID=UPI00403838A9